MGTIITRIGFCPTCEQRGYPMSGQKYLAFGSTSGDYKVMTSKWNGICGFVPHIYVLEKVLPSGFVRVSKCCAMNNHGVKTRYEMSEGQKELFYYLNQDLFVTEDWRVGDWNALVGLKHNQFTECYEI